ncbi:MAG TPA: GreA/GreB family elongation factor [Candidatus Saccharimonadales bacterium]|nr:GreA/GreB family elongation factor [Candidatus Saccharimonadales bacterium]
MRIAQRTNKVRRDLYYLSQEGFKRFKKRLRSLRNEHAHSLRTLRALKDARSANKYEERISLTEQVNQLQLIEEEIIETEYILKKAKLLPRIRQATKVKLGSHVHLKGDGKELAYTIVDPLEADPAQGKISNESPFGQNLIGRKIRDVIQWSFGPAGAKPINLQIVGIS